MSDPESINHHSCQTNSGFGPNMLHIQMDNYHQWKQCLTIPAFSKVIGIATSGLMPITSGGQPFTANERRIPVIGRLLCLIKSHQQHSYSIITRLGLPSKTKQPRTAWMEGWWPDDVELTGLHFRFTSTFSQETPGSCRWSYGVHAWWGAISELPCGRRPSHTR